MPTDLDDECACGMDHETLCPECGAEGWSWDTCVCLACEEEFTCSR